MAEHDEAFGSLREFFGVIIGNRRLMSVITSALRRQRSDVRIISGAPLFHSQTRKPADFLAFSPTGGTRKGYKVHQRSWFSHMLYASRRRGIWRYRRAVPEPLRAFAGRREYIVSLETRDDAEAGQRHANIHVEAEQQFAQCRAQASGAEDKNSDDDEWAKGHRFLKRVGLDYVSLESLKADHDVNGYSAQPSEFEKRLAIVNERLGIETDDEETRDEAINGSLEARAMLGDLRRPVLRLSGALNIYLGGESGRPVTNGRGLCKTFSAREAACDSTFADGAWRRQACHQPHQGRRTDIS